MRQHVLANIAKYFVMVLSVVSLIREIIQIFHYKKRYLSLENLIEWVTHVSAFLLVLDLDECMAHTGLRTVSIICSER